MRVKGVKWLGCVERTAECGALIGVGGVYCSSSTSDQFWWYAHGRTCPPNNPVRLEIVLVEMTKPYNNDSREYSQLAVPLSK